jgi:hypothetical protein
MLFWYVVVNLLNIKYILYIKGMRIIILYIKGMRIIIFTNLTHTHIYIKGMRIIIFTNHTHIYTICDKQNRASIYIYNVVNKLEKDKCV